MVHKIEKGVVVGETTYKDMGIDPADVLRKQKKGDHGDWRTM
jgi:hypothetical protein